MAGILSTTNAYNFGMMVSTNFVNWDGFDPNPPYDLRTNVNYGWKRNGQPLTANEALQNLANLLLNPRPPVFITNRFFANSNEFRFYDDLNRNGRYDTNGFWPVISGDPTRPFYSTNGNLLPLLRPGITASNYFVGDPEWIGILERPDRPHSATNRFIARYAYIVVPAGKTLDVNYVHNQAKTLPARAEGFLRNQGVGSWEMNLAAFLVDLNTNMWLVPGPQGYGSPYLYNPNGINTGSGFDDAFPLLRYRYGIAVNPLPLPTPSVQYLFGAPGATAFSRDFVDGYTRGPLMTSPWGWGVTVDQDTVARAAISWSGGDTRSNYFTTQDFYDKTKTSVNNPNLFSFTDRLLIAGTNNPNNSPYGPSSYDRYTFYRLLSQLGTDSPAEPPGKININYLNAGGVSATNFIAWDDPDIPNGNPARGIPRFNVPGSVLFFTNAAHKLLVEYSSEWLNANSNVFFATYRTNKAFGVTDIPVLVNSNFVYTPSIHRVLQLAANTYDTAISPSIPSSTSSQLPRVFRPIIRRQGSDVYVVGYAEVGVVSGANDPRFAKPLDLSKPAELALVPLVGTPPLPTDVNVYGVPWVIGAKKGLPNFNEYAMQPVFQVTRKLEIRRRSLSAPQSRWTTNLMYVVGVSNYVGAEAWNSYRTNLNRAVDVIVANEMSMALTNNFWQVGVSNYNSFASVISVPAPPSPQQWSGYYPGTTNSFLVPLRTSVALVTNQPYQFSPPAFITDPRLAWVPFQAQAPQWKLVVNSKLRFIILDTLTRRVIDYVQLDGLNSMRDVSEEIRDPDNAVGFAGLWSTNMVGGGLPQGILNQMTISMGINGANAADWKPYDLGTHSTKDFEIDYFRVLYGLSPLKYPNLVANTSLVQQVPFSPTKRVQQHLTWQANDPLVHYTPGDLAFLKTAGSLIKGFSTDPPINNIGRLNTRYEPWGGNPERGSIDPAKDFNSALKDPGVRQSDDWQFPTNKFPNIGWLGRVHRGSPWQTIYMKSSDVDTNTSPAARNAWQDWTGNGNYIDAMQTRPMNDRILFDVFTTAFNENATRGQLSVNQSGLAAWSALFSGVVALTNTFPNSALPVTNYTIIEPAGIYDSGNTNTWSPLVRIVQGINRERTRGLLAGTNIVYAHPGQTFRHVGDIFSVPELTDASPYLNVIPNSDSFKKGLNDAVYEWLPQQVMSLLHVGEPRFVVYSYGQTLRPAPASIITSGTFQGLCTNYQVTAEAAMRAVVRIEGAPTGTTSTSPRVVIEKFNLLPPD
jgi:hypothetical protein